MLRLSKSVEYALIALNYLASQRKDEVCSAKKIAKECQIPNELLAKILQKLSSIGLIESLKGAAGGYSLKKASVNLNIYELIKIIDGPVSLIDCAVSTNCDLLDQCKIKAPLMKINNQIINTLKSITVDQIR